jgi:cobalamin biosynthesis Mg chelatase CobN
MNKGYDPLSYGQVSLGGANKAKESAEDLLFDEKAASSVASGGSGNWAAPEQFSETSTSNFVTALAMGPELVDPAPPTVPGMKGDAVASTTPASSAGKTSDRGTRQKAVVVAASTREAQTIGLGSPQQSGALTAAAPFVVLLVVESLAGWLWLGQQNPVMAGLAAAFGLGLAAMSWCALRR